MRGVDVTRNAPVVNYGNYGVMYDVDFRTRGKNDTRLRFNPYGGAYAGFGVLTVQGQTARYIRIPDNGLSFGWDHDGETMKLGQVPAGKSAAFYFSPPGSSNLPVRIFLEGSMDPGTGKSPAGSGPPKKSWQSGWPEKNRIQIKLNENNY